MVNLKIAAGAFLCVAGLFLDRAAGQTDRGAALNNAALTKVLRHPGGVSVRYPQDWTVQEAQGGVFQLIPPGWGPDQGELYLISGEAANGITTAEDPRVTLFLEQFLAQNAPALRRVGTAEKLQTQSAPGIALRWEGGNNGLAVVFVVVLKNAAIALTGLGLKSKIEAREPMLRQIFASFSAGESEKDPRVVGVWTRLSTTGLDAHDAAGRLQASSASDHQRTLLLRADGTCASREVDITFANSAAVGLESNQVTVKNGQWFAGDGRIGFNWEKDGELYRYEVTGTPGNRRLMLKQDDGKVVTWQESR